MEALVIGLGQPAAGDDAVGFAVLEHIRQSGWPAGTELAEANEATALIELLQTTRRVVLVDAIVGHPRVGDVLELPEEALAVARSGRRPLSTHGVAVGQAIELARIVASGAVSRDVSLVGVAIAPPKRWRRGLSPAVQAAVPVAARVVLSRVGR